jgi:hypothetical protein
MAERFNADELHLEHLSLREARNKAIEMLKGTNTKATKLGNLIRDIERAPSPREVQRIMWQTMLAGNGLGIVGSQWQKLHKLAGG